MKKKKYLIDGDTVSVVLDDIGDIWITDVQDGDRVLILGEALGDLISTLNEIKEKLREK